MFKPENAKKRVFVAMSGGVDSSVAAALLKEQGYNVAGVFMKLWNQRDGNSEAKKRPCCSDDSERSARKMAEILRIPFFVFDFEKEFKQKVVDYFIAAEKAGLTPNPCVVCNKEIKFGLLVEKALCLGADYIATGHYAKIKTQSSKLKTQNHNSKLKIFKLLEGVDEQKDQSYFLWKLNQKQLSKILFPVGGYLKPEVREMAKNFGLPVFNRPESQEICFVENKVEDFLEEFIAENPGDIFFKGKKIGGHKGLHFYTIGQRKRINIFNGPYFVSDKDLKNNRLIVEKNEDRLLKKEIFVGGLNWISGKSPKLPLDVLVKTRYKQEEIKAKINKIAESDNLKVIFEKPVRAPSPGQSAVFYVGDEVLGGGTIGLDYHFALK